MVRVLAALQRSEEAPRLVEPVPALLQALGAGARHPLLRWLLPLCRTWCALLRKPVSAVPAITECYMRRPITKPMRCSAGRRQKVRTAGRTLCVFQVQAHVT